MVMDHAGEALTCSQYKTLLAIASYAAPDGTNAFPGLDSIARRARVNKRTAQRAIVAIERAGDLLVEYKAGPKGTNRYVVTATRHVDTPARDLDTLDVHVDLDKSEKYLDTQRPPEVQIEGPVFPAF
jgi:hypothetical protein